MPTATSAFGDFWTEFVRSNADPAVRRARVIATGFALGGVALSIVSRRAWPLLIPVARWAGECARRPGGLPRVAHVVAADLVLLWNTIHGAAEEETASPPTRPPHDAGPRPNMATDHTLH
jgi:hypothetical protein